MNKVLITIVFFFSLALIQAREYVDVTFGTSTQMSRVNNEDVYFEFPHFIFSHTNTLITIKFKNPNHPKLTGNNSKLHFIVNGDDQLVAFDKNGVGSLSTTFKSNNKLSVLFEDVAYNMEMPVISIWYMILPLATLLLFLVYKIMFSKKSLSISETKETENMIDPSTRSKFKIVPLKQEEEMETV